MSGARHAEIMSRDELETPTNAACICIRWQAGPASHPLDALCFVQLSMRDVALYWQYFVAPEGPDLVHFYAPDKNIHVVARPGSFFV